ncbi:MAG: (Fe-S)-binding protein [Deltaproteobacteria bacterium]|jgi:Fe-S oxidoreductase|nr:(Fe-S)-binding protein [Deltaproteobacteria bacterium]MBW2532916.1 (Fe-S)-binding protein [Deltaproteobacteria bacterium]
MSKHVSIKDFSKGKGPLTEVEHDDLIPLPPPYDKDDDTPKMEPLKEEAKDKYVELDGTIALGLPKPKNKKEEEKLVNDFLSGLRKCFSEDDNWTFLQPLEVSMEHCAKCQTCNDACPIYLESGKNDLYRPTFRSEIFRRIYKKYIQKKSTWVHGDVDLNWKTVMRLIELSFRCNVCRRCAQTCPIGVDNALIAREIRKIASQEMGITARELHKDGSELQLKVGSSTGMNTLVLMDNMEFIDEDTEEKTGIETKTPFDVEGADILLIHNAGEIMAWPDNVGAFTTLFNAAGLSWTMSSDLAAYDGINYGVWYDDVQFARVALLHMQAAKKLGVKKVVLGECGHAHKALTVIADKVLTGDLNIPRESCFVTLLDILREGKIKFDKSRNDFPVPLHDPCNLVRLMGIVSPQREIIEHVVPKERFREMAPHGVHNYCCGGGSGFAIMSGNNFGDWKMHMTGRRKFRQILEAFADEDLNDPEQPKYVCAPCSNCKGQIRDILRYYNATERSGIYYSGLVELMVNAMVDAKPGYIDFEEMQMG